jgi:hypothetical protein
MIKIGRCENANHEISAAQNENTNLRCVFFCKWSDSNFSTFYFLNLAHATVAKIATKVKCLQKLHDLY